MAHRTLAVARKRRSPDEETGGAVMCVSGCGFFGTAATNNMCSKCYREHLLATATLEEAANSMTRVFAAASSAPPEKKAKTSVTVALSSYGAAAAAAAAGVEPSSLTVTTMEQPASGKPSTAANRCVTCRRKVGLMGFRCRCGGTFCGVHRYSDAHSCGFDYKSAGREQIARQNPLAVADKIVRI